MDGWKRGRKGGEREKESSQIFFQEENEPAVVGQVS